MRKNRYLHPGDLVPLGQPKQHVRSDDGRLILYWDLPEERVFLQAFDSLGNYRILEGVVQAPKKVYTCAVCRTERSPDQVCPRCTLTYSANGVLPPWVLEMVKIQDRAIQDGYQVYSLDSNPSVPPLQPFRWPLNHSYALREANHMVQEALREAERSSTPSTGIRLDEYRQINSAHRAISRPRWNGYRNV